MGQTLWQGRGFAKSRRDAAARLVNWLAAGRSGNEKPLARAGCFAA
jgi:hypothetical protein